MPFQVHWQLAFVPALATDFGRPTRALASCLTTLPSIAATVLTDLHCNRYPQRQLRDPNVHIPLQHRIDITRQRRGRGPSGSTENVDDKACQYGLSAARDPTTP